MMLGCNCIGGDIEGDVCSGGGGGDGRDGSSCVDVGVLCGSAGGGGPGDSGGGGGLWLVGGGGALLLVMRFNILFMSEEG